jgi:hypothetical protein
VLDPTQKKPKGVGILGKGFEKKKTKGQGSWTMDSPCTSNPLLTHHIIISPTSIVVQLR